MCAKDHLLTGEQDRPLIDQLKIRFGLSELHLLGEGLESRIYAIDSERILRVPKSYKSDEMAERESFLAIVNRGTYPYAVPEVLETGEYNGHLFAVERRLSGSEMRKRFPSLSTSERQLAMNRFLEAIQPLATADVSDLPFGEITGKDRIEGSSWSQYLRRKSELVLSFTRSKLESAVPQLDRTLGRFFEGIEALEGYQQKRLVHGDYYPAHVMMNDDLEVTGLLDFSRLTIVGDPLIDVGEALSTFEDPLRPEGSTESAECFRSLIIERYGRDALRDIRTYQLYYGLNFSDCEPSDPVTYDWCVRTLRGDIWEIE